MTVKIKNKIVSQRVVIEEDQAPSNVVEFNPIVMHEGIVRPDLLLGTTYKIKPPEHISPHAMYVTINDMLLNEGTDHERLVPYEIFINSKAMNHFQWIIALTRVISSVFRKGGDVTFLIGELGSVYDPNGGYMKKGGILMPSLVAELGGVIKKHMKRLGLVEDEELSEHTKKILAEKRAAFDKQNANATDSDYPANATVCNKCNVKAMIRMDNCDTCLECGNSKCG